jgi:hypothetical protein
LSDLSKFLPVRDIHGMATAIKADPGMGDYHSGEYILSFCHTLFLSRLRSTCMSPDSGLMLSLIMLSLIIRADAYPLSIALASDRPSSLPRTCDYFYDAETRQVTPRLSRQASALGNVDVCPTWPATMGVAIHALLQRAIGIPYLHICAHVRSFWMKSQRTLLL